MTDPLTRITSTHPVIARLLRQSKLFKVCHDRFVELATTNPRYAIETYGDTVLIAQAKYDRARKLLGMIVENPELDPLPPSLMRSVLEIERTSLLSDLTKHAPWRHNSTSMMANASNSADACAIGFIVELIDELLALVPNEEKE